MDNLEEIVFYYTVAYKSVMMAWKPSSNYHEFMASVAMEWLN